MLSYRRLLRREGLSGFARGSATHGPLADENPDKQCRCNELNKNLDDLLRGGSCGLLHGRLGDPQGEV